MRKEQLVNFISLCLFIVGLFLILNAGLPVLSYEISSAKFQKTRLISPVEAKAPAFVPFETIDSNDQTGLVRASNWFEGTPSLPNVVSKVSYYNLSIPRLKINDAVVEIGGDNLNKNLVQYKGTANPGREGNTVIFGHSSLPQFFSPTNYLSIFAKLPNLQVGDELVVNYDGITYKYKIEEMFEVGPTDIEVLAQSYDDSYLTLVTCVPPGTFLRRLIVRARLAPQN